MEFIGSTVVVNESFDSATLVRKVPPLAEVKDGKFVNLNFHEGQARAWLSNARIILALGGSQSGKALALDTPIPTSGGFKSMGDIKVGDRVYDRLGRLCNVWGVSPTYYNHACFKVKFSNGDSIVADQDHLWGIIDRMHPDVIRTLFTVDLLQLWSHKRFGLPLHKTPEAEYLHEDICVNKVTFEGNVPVKCIAVDSWDHMYLCGRSMVPTHNSEFGPFWLAREIGLRGPGDYLIAGPNFPLLSKKVMPAFLKLFKRQLKWGQLTGRSQHFELNSYAQKCLWGKVQDEETKIFFGHAMDPDSLESATAKAVWLDECLAPETMVLTEYGNIAISHIVNNLLPLRVWSFDTVASEWQLRPILRWFRRPQQRPLLSIGPLRITGNHKVWTKRGYIPVGELGCKEEIYAMRSMWDAFGRTKAFLQQELQADVFLGRQEMAQENDQAYENCRCEVQSQKSVFEGYDVANEESCQSQEDFRCSETALFRSIEPSLVSARRRIGNFVNRIPKGSIKTCKERQTVAQRRQWTSFELEAEISRGLIRMGLRVRGQDQKWMETSLLQDRRCRSGFENSNRSWQQSESSQARMVRFEWMDLHEIHQQNGGNLHGWMSQDNCVYNLEVEENHNYVANGILVANCGQKKFKIGSWEAINRRVAVNRGRILMTTTPYAVTGWLKQVYDRAKKELRDRNPNPTYFVSEFESIANPAFPKEEYDRAKKELPEWKFDLFYRGRFTKPPGAIYDIFTRDRHTCISFNVPTEWSRIVGMDFGGVNTAATFYAAEREWDGDIQEWGNTTGRYFLYKEYFPRRGKTAADHAKSIYLGEPKIPKCVGGSSSEGQWRKEFAAAGLPVMDPAIGDKEGTTTEGRVEVGINRVYALLASDNLVVFDSCTQTIEDLQNYSRELDDKGDATDDIEDKSDYHLGDSVRYFAFYVKRKRKEADMW